MIARARLAHQILENPTKNRVTACRKRVRDHRSGHRLSRPQATSHSEQTSTMAQFPADSSEVRQLATLELSSSFDDEPAESVVQEVGIT